MTSCSEPGVIYSQKIQNDSDFDIIIHVQGGFVPGSSYSYDSTDSFYVNNHTVDTIMLYWEVPCSYTSNYNSAFIFSLTQFYA